MVRIARRNASGFLLRLTPAVKEQGANRSRLEGGYSAADFSALPASRLRKSYFSCSSFSAA